MSLKIILLSFIIGFFIGATTYAVFPWTLEAAQIASGKIVYPQTDPVLVSYTALYSPLTKWGGALVLRAGLPLESVARLFSGIQGAVCFSAATGILLALGGGTFLSLLFPLILSRLAYPIFLEHKYPNFFPVSHNDAGMLGLYFLILVVSLILLRHYKSGLFFLGILLCIHPTLALPGYIIIAILLMIDRKKSWSKASYAKKWFFLGAGIFALSLVLHKIENIAFQPLVTGWGSQLAWDYLQYWNVHRQPIFPQFTLLGRIGFFETEIILFSLTLIVWLRPHKQIPQTIKSLLLALSAMSLIAVTAVLIDEVNFAILPFGIKMLMISRWLNINSVLVPVLLFCLICRLMTNNYRHGRLFIVFQVLGLIGFAGDTSRWWYRALFFPYMRIWVPILFVLICIKPIKRKLGSKGLKLNSSIAGVVIFSMILLNLFHGGVKKRLIREEDLPLFQTAVMGKGMVLVAPRLISWPQIYLQRPILLNVDLLDDIAYVPSQAEKMEVILNQVYGLSITDHRNWQSLVGVKSLWESRSPREWSNLRSIYQVSNVLTPLDWKLNLKPVISSDRYRLYEID